MEDEPVTLKQVVATIVLGAVIGLLLTLLLYVASPTAREQINWLGPFIVGICIVVCLYVRYAPWWAHWIDWW